MKRGKRREKTEGVECSGGTTEREKRHTKKEKEISLLAAAGL